MAAPRGGANAFGWDAATAARERRERWNELDRENRPNLAPAGAADDDDDDGGGAGEEDERARARAPVEDEANEANEAND